MFNLLKSQINSDLNRKLKIDRINPIMNQVYNQINEQSDLLSGQGSDLQSGQGSGIRNH